MLIPIMSCPFSNIKNTLNPLFKSAVPSFDFNQRTVLDILKRKVIEEERLIFYHVSEFPMYIILLHPPSNSEKSNNAQGYQARNGKTVM